MNITVYCGSSVGNKEIFVRKCAELGRWIGENGHTLVYGGANAGIMGAVADAVLAAGGRVTGVLPNVPLILGRRHPGLTECILTETVAERKMKMIDLADAFIALPGGIGTIDEITEVISLASLGIVTKPIVFFDTDAYYAGMRAVLSDIVKNGFGKEAYFRDILFSDDIEKIAALLCAAENRSKREAL